MRTKAAARTTGREAGLRERWRAARGRRWVRWGLDGLLLGLALAAVSAWQTRDLPDAGTPAPDFALPALEGGEPVRLSSLRGKPVVLHFWAPWCGVCGAASDNLGALQERVGGEAHVLSVAVEYARVEDVRRFVQEHGARYPVVLGDEAVREAFRVGAFPTTFFLSPEGRIRRAAVGYTTRLGLHARLWW